MIIKVILSLLFGMAIGVNIVVKLNKDSDEIQSDLIKAYDGYIKYLEEDYIGFYRDALNETLNQNIELRKKLKVYE